MTIEEDKQLVYNNIADKILVYKYLLNRLLKRCRDTKSRLDIHREQLHNGNMAIQLSVIYLSSASTFIQALSAKNYEVIFSDISDQGLLNSTDSIESGIEGNAEVEQNTFADISPIITLSITTYSAAIIAFARHLKIDEQESNVATLIDRFAELVNRIQFHIDNLKPWSYSEYYENKEKRIKEWSELEAKIEAKYIRLLEKKKELFTAYEKIIDTAATQKFKKLFKKLRENNKESIDSESDEECPKPAHSTIKKSDFKQKLDKFTPKEKEKEKEKEDEIQVVIESITKGDNEDNADNADNADNGDNENKEDKVDKVDKEDNADNAENAENVDNADNADNTDKVDKVDKDELDTTSQNRDTRSQTPPRSRSWSITNFMNY